MKNIHQKKNIFITVFLFLFWLFSSFIFSAQGQTSVSQGVYVCGDGVCDDGEDYSNCPEDCPTTSPSPSESGLFVPPPFSSSPSPSFTPTPTPTFFPTPSFSPEIPSPSPTYFFPTPPLPTFTFVVPPPLPPVPPSPPVSSITFVPTISPTFIPSFVPSVPSFPQPKLKLSLPPEVVKIVKPTSKTIVSVGLGVYFFSSLLGLIPQAKTLQDLIFLPLRLLSLFFFVKREYWGVVYDSINKQPLDPAIVVLKDKNGKKLKTQITDIYGRYSFLVKEGEYYLEVKKTNYRFPSLFLKDRKRDEIYDNLYHGELIRVSKTMPLTFNIPLDPVGVDWNQIAKKKYAKFNYQIELIKKHFPTLIFYFGLALSFLIWYLEPVPFNRNVLVVYLVLFLMRAFGFKPREYGFVLQKETKKPLSFSLITVFFEGLNYPVKKIMTDEGGRYHLLVEKGTYDLKISKKEEIGEFKDLALFKEIKAPKGIIKKDFKV